MGNLKNDRVLFSPFTSFIVKVIMEIFRGKILLGDKEITVD